MLGEISWEPFMPAMAAVVMLQEGKATQQRGVFCGAWPSCFFWSSDLSLELSDDRAELFTLIIPSAVPSKPAGKTLCSRSKDSS